MLTLRDWYRIVVANSLFELFTAMYMFENRFGMYMGSIEEC